MKRELIIPIYFEREYPGFQTGEIQCHAILLIENLESRIERERKYHGLQPVEVYSDTGSERLSRRLIKQLKA